MKVIFLDRDGVINRDRPDHVKAWSEFEFLPGSLEAIRLLSNNGYSIILITNQSAVNRRLITEKGLAIIHERMIRRIEETGGRIEAIYFCPHTPDQGCECRKPKPGLIYKAQADYKLDLSKTCMIGDSLKDIECGWKAGCGKTVLVRTGKGKKTEPLLQKDGPKPDFIADDLLAAGKWLLT
nr:D-glycero-beta-D-manno-heptose 1,7-bisphosphate 7-phosphatase [Desulfobacterales bacterium]